MVHDGGGNSEQSTESSGAKSYNTECEDKVTSLFGPIEVGFATRLESLIKRVSASSKTLIAILSLSQHTPPRVSPPRGKWLPNRLVRVCLLD
eukprot:XP_025979949.1 uncharacterized protein LOC100785591 isoform X2 [Glycine max]